MSFKKLALIQGSPEWLEARFNYVTASNVPALFGVSPYKTALEYATELLSKKEKDVTTGKEAIFARGHEVEKAAREWARKELGHDFKPEVVVPDSFPILLASLDGLDEQQRVVFEAKYVGRETLKGVLAGKLPAHHELQVQAQLLATGFEKLVYFAMDADHNSAVMDVHADMGMHLEIIEKAGQFWNDLKEGKLPEPAEKDVLKVEDTDLRRLAELDRQIKALSKDYDAIEEVVLKRYEVSARVQGEGVSITKYWSKGTVDWTALAKAKRIPAEEQERFRKAGALRTKITVRQS